MADPVVRLPERPFASGWEQSPLKDTCAHTWQTVFAESRPGKFVEVDRCIDCHTPRCGDPLDADPCIERRHHEGVHIYESGRFEPLGGHIEGVVQ